MTRPGGRRNSSSPFDELAKKRAGSSLDTGRSQHDVGRSPPAGTGQLGVIFRFQGRQTSALDPEEHAAGRMHRDAVIELVELLSGDLAAIPPARGRPSRLPNRIDPRTVQVARGFRASAASKPRAFDVAASIGSGTMKEGSRWMSR